jgi:signal transduction histidine kinase/DNA-binding NarL/FixJ family response regulator
VHSLTNTRILVIDDEEVVRDSIREILIPRRQDTTRMDRAASTLFDDGDLGVVEARPNSRSPGIDAELDLSEAGSGAEGLQRIRAAVHSGRPFAVIFLDMRMPGWDGLETARRIREIDRAAQIIFVTAYSDHSVDEIVKQAGSNVGYHCKPFSPEEIRQIASKGIYDWNKIHNLERLIEAMGRIRSQPAEVETLLQNILEQISEWVGTSSVLLARGNKSREYAPLVGCGPLGEAQRAERLLRGLGGQSLPDATFRFEGILLRGVAEGDIIAVWEDEERVNTERFYLLRLFVEHAFQVIENAKLHEQVLVGEKLSAVGRAIGTVAHDIRSPISGIQSALDVMKMSLGDPEQIHEMLDLIGQSAEDAMAMVCDILDFTKQSSIEKQSFRVEELFESVIRQTRDVIAVHRVRMVTACEPGLRILGDLRKLGRVLINLIANAAEALSAHDDPDPQVVLSARTSEEMVLIEVADNGPGIPQRIRGTLFEPFVTHGKSNGTGLGLAIARQIVQAHGGELSFMTNDEGTTFSLELPQPDLKSIATTRAATPGGSVLTRVEGARPSTVMGAMSAGCGRPSWES